MGLFTNRRKQEATRPLDLLANGAADDEWVDPAEELGLNGDLWDLAPPPPPPAPAADPAATNSELLVEASSVGDHAAPGLPMTTSLFDSPQRRRASDPSSPLAQPSPPTEPSPPMEPSPPASAQLEEMGISLADQQPTVPPPPRRVRRSILESPEPAPIERRLAGNLGFDEQGLLDMLGLPLQSDLRQVSAATTAFLADLDPDSELDPEASELKRRIRREVNTAYATYRLIKGR